MVNVCNGIRSGRTGRCGIGMWVWGRIWEKTFSERGYMGFYEQTNFRGDISKWDTSSEKSMESMFFGATSFIGENLSNWYVSR